MFCCTLYNPFTQLPTSIYMVTEEATPLEDYLATSDGKSNFSISWGLHQVIVRELIILFGVMYNSHGLILYYGMCSSCSDEVIVVYMYVCHHSI